MLKSGLFPFRVKVFAHRNFPQTPLKSTEKMWKISGNVAYLKFCRFFTLLWKNSMFKIFETRHLKLCGKVWFSFVAKGFLCATPRVDFSRFYVDKLLKTPNSQIFAIFPYFFANFSLDRHKRQTKRVFAQSPYAHCVFYRGGICNGKKQGIQSLHHKMLFSCVLIVVCAKILVYARNKLRIQI